MHCSYGLPSPASRLICCPEESSRPDEVKLLAPVGTVVVFNSDLWHGGTLNASPVRRRAMHSAFVLPRRAMA